MITAGVDLAATPERTALASIEWSGTRAVIREVICPADDEAILNVIEQADKTGIDCPFGWPSAFVDFVASHHSGHVGLLNGGMNATWRRNLTMRRTDAFVQDMLHAAPLSVSADKIAHVALRCAVLLAVLDARGHPVDRTGAGTVVEVYPAASLRRWRLYRPGYKGRAKSEVLADLIEQVLAEVPWLDCGSYRENIRRSDDVFDAVIAAMTARAAARGLTIPPDQDNMAAARAEGWIAIPDSPIGQLV